MTKSCQNCKTDFVIEDEDLAFYKKIDVPPPTWCPQCRLQRRLSFFNLTNLFKRPCDLCKKEVVSIYPPEVPYTVYCLNCWWSDKWDPKSYERDFDPARPFLAQLNELIHQVPLITLSIDQETRANSPYNNHVSALKNCYLLFQAAHCEDSAYGFYLQYSKNILDSSLIYSSEKIYNSSNCYRDNNCIGLRHQVTETIDSAFLSYSHNCQSCFASRNLRNKKYVAFNKQYTKEEYREIVGQYDLGSWKVYQEVQKMAEDHWKTLPPDPDVSMRNMDSTGSTFFDCKNCKECYEVVGAENCKYMLLIGTGPVSGCYDISSWGDNMSQCYECMNCGVGASRIRFTFDSGLGLDNAEYAFGAIGSSDIFGSVFLNKAKRCILNKAYDQQSYKELREKVIQHMNEMPYVDSLGRKYPYGEFFPSEFSPFPYNLTFANLFFPLTKDKALAQGYAWRDREVQEYVHTMEAKDLPDNIKDVPDMITKEIVACEKCARGFRILESELAQRRSMNVPLPRTCPFCRIEEKMRGWVKSLTLHDRVCANCGVSFRTNFDETEAPYILCKSCYTKEVA
ncbi:MAG: hypothetical protein AAB903_01455 [Patescibacteria group bacterium]